jgi:colanic acid/amylovoran biosynthesis protein
MRILLIGQTTLHWGRMEFGNIGNYYIIEPFIRELHKVFNGSEIHTTFQMSDRFSRDEGVNILPMDLYYGWKENDLEIALEEFASAYLFHQTGNLPKTSRYIEEVVKSDLVIDFSGDMWGDNANFLGKDRFLVGLLKDRVAQLMGKRTAMIAGSPGPFNSKETLKFAQEVFKNFDLVTNREAVSIELLRERDFDVSKVVNLACPAFLFQPCDSAEMDDIIASQKIDGKDKPVFGFILCGWNFISGPFDKWPRSDDEYVQFAEAVEFITEVIGARVFLLSHSNGFPPPPASFKLIHGRDYQIVKQLEDVLIKRGISKDFHVLESVLDAWQTKAVISRFDVLVSGRVHGAVAGLSQLIPTVIIDYGHEPKAHKLRGFALEAGMEEYLADPSIKNDIIKKIELCWLNRSELRNKLARQIPIVQEKARENFSKVGNLFAV